MKSTLKALFEIDGLLEAFKRKKAEHVAALRTMAGEETLAKIESELHELQKSIYAKDFYTNPRRFINWN